MLMSGDRNSEIIVATFLDGYMGLTAHFTKEITTIQTFVCWKVWKIQY